MMGLEMYGDDLGAMLSAEGLKESLMAGAVGAGGILLTATVLGKWTQPTTGMFAATPPAGTDPASWNGSMNFRRAKGALSALIGILGGRAMHDRNRDAAMAFTGAVAGMGFADLIASWVPANQDGTPMVKANLQGGYLSGADLRMLEAAVATPMAAWRPSYEMAGLAGPVAQTRRLQGLGAPVVSNTELGGQYESYLF